MSLEQESQTSIEPVVEKSTTQSFYNHRDKIAFCITATVAFLCYLFTLAPSVTLEDSGEFLTAARHLGVPHPPGYPVWTILAWIWQLIIPFGNIAWRVNLMSAFCSALAVGLASLLVSKSGHVMANNVGFLRELKDKQLVDLMILVSSVSAGLILAFSPVMWSQAVITEVYGLNVLVLMATLVLLYRWSFETDRLWRLYLAAFLWGIGLTVHQTLILLTVAFPAFVWFSHKKLGRDALIPILLLVTAALLKMELTALDQLKYMLSQIKSLPIEQLTVLHVLFNLGHPAMEPWAFPIFIQFCGAALLGTWLVYISRKEGWFMLVFAGILILGLAFSWNGWKNMFPIMIQSAPAPAETGLILMLLGFILAGVTCCWILYFGKDRGWRKNILLTGAISSSCTAILGTLIFCLHLIKKEITVEQEIVASLNFTVAGVIFIIIACGWAYWVLKRNLARVQIWSKVCTLYAAVMLGISFYAYMPLSSATNPPMNWGYTRTPEGFIHHFTRGQYEKVHTERLLMKFWGQLCMFTGDIASQFNIVYMLIPLLALFLYFDMDKRDRNWLKFLFIAFLWLGVGFIFLSNPTFEKQKQFTDRVFFLPCHCIYALCIGYGLILGSGYLFLRNPRFRMAAGPIAAGILLLPSVTLITNWRSNEQRGHDFGYRFGYLMFNPGGEYPEMDRNAVLFGGTDPGRFVPTYMIFVESQSKAKTILPEYPGSATFDRRDVNIITQNALADNTYMNYVRDHYSHERPDLQNEETIKNRSLWQKILFKFGWHTLGRSTTYPQQSIWIPSDEDTQKAFQEYVYELQSRQPGTGEDVQIQGDHVSVQGIQGVMAINGILTKMIFEKNKKHHSFYIEESYAIPWMYPYIEPYGIILKLHKEPLEQIDTAVVARDRKYWDKLTIELALNPQFKRDDVAQKTFSKLRAAIGGIYHYRKMLPEAEYAYRQAADLCPDSPEANFRLAQLFVEQGRYEEALSQIRQYQKLDPYNLKIEEAINAVHHMQESSSAESTLIQQLAIQPKNVDLAWRLALIYAQQRRMDDLDAHVDKYVAINDIPADLLLQFAQLYIEVSRLDRVLTILSTLTERQPENILGWYNLALVHSTQNNCEASANALQNVLSLDPPDGQFHTFARQEQRFAHCTQNPKFQQILMGSISNSVVTNELQH